MVKVTKKEVTFLAFEGGGGKGLTYLGALQALEELEIVSYKTKKIFKLFLKFSNELHPLSFKINN